MTCIEPPGSSREESTGDAELDRRLTEPVLKGDHGIDTAQVWISAVLVLVVSSLVFSGSLGIPFQIDELSAVSDTARFGALTAVSYAANALLAPSAAAYHAVNLGIHLVNALLLFLLCRKLFSTSGPMTALAGSLLFAVHPLTTQTVNSLEGRAYLLSAGFIMAGLLAYTGAWKTDEETGLKLDPWRLGLSLIALACSWGAGSTAVVMPALIMVLDVLLHGKRRLGARLGVYAIFWGALSGLLVVHIAGGGRLDLFSSNSVPMTELLRLLVWPEGLSPVHASGSTFVDFAVVFFCLAVGILWSAFRSVAGLAVSWCALTVLLMIDGAGECAGYITMAGAALLLPSGLSLLGKPELKTAAGLAAAGMILAAAIGAYLRNLTWQDEMALWLDAAEKAPQSAVPPIRLAKILINQAQLSGNADLMVQAEPYVRDAIAKNVQSPAEKGHPPADDTTYLLAVVLAGQGRSDEALALFDQVLAADVTHRSAMIHAAGLLAVRHANAGVSGDLVRAVELYRKAESIGPLEGQPLANYAQALLELGEFEAAEVALKRLPEPFGPLLEHAVEMRDRIRAVEQQKASLAAKNPKDPSLLKLQAQILVYRRKAIPAAYLLETYKRENGLDFGAWLLLGLARAMSDSTDHFVAENPPPAKPPNVDAVWLELAKACAASNLWDAARSYLEKEPARRELGASPLVVLADIAAEFGSPRGREFLEGAVRENPADPVPYLKLADYSIAAEDKEAAANYLAEAEKRGADAGELDKRRRRIAP